jgi:DNA-directed RNA polymerase specialized sigma24 family protein
MNTIEQILAPVAPNAESARATRLFDQRADLVMKSVEQNHTYLINYLKAFAPPDYVEDVVQELWKYVLLNFPIEKIQNLGLLRKKAYQLFIDQYRKAKVLNDAKTKILLEPAPPSGEAAFDVSSETDLKNRFWSEYDVELTALQKEVVWYHARYGMTFDEIEIALGVKASTACDWMKIARTKIAALIEGEC